MSDDEPAIVIPSSDGERYFEGATLTDSEAVAAVDRIAADLDEPASPNSLPGRGSGDAAASLSPHDDAAIDDLLSLHQAMHWLQGARSRIAENELTAKREHELIDEWLRTATEHDRREEAFWLAKATAYALRRRQETGGREKSQTGPHGRIETTAQEAEYVRDDPTLIAWAESHGYMRERVVREIDWKRLKADVIPHAGGVVLLAGDVVPGIVHRPREPKVTVTTWE